MAIVIYRGRDQQRLRTAGRIAAEILAAVGERLVPGVSGADINRWVALETERRGARPSQLGYHGFPGVVCVSPNHVVCHGLPSADVVLSEGDIVNIDVTAEYDGFHGDTSRTFVLGSCSDVARRLVDTCESSLRRAIAGVAPGRRLGDIGAAIVESAVANGFSVVREYGGHGIGRHMHEAPHVSHVGRGGTGPRLREGMAFTIEPMLNQGSADVRLSADGWTVVTADGGLSAQFEHTVLVTADGAEVLTVAGS